VDVDAVRGRLEQERREATCRLAALSGDYASVVEASRDSNADDEHDPEGATIAFERSQIGALVDQVRERLQEVEAALQRLDEGSYGVCVRCGAAIAEGRLEARPTALLCVRCAAALG
jgi:RNA polymerase-binding transcription factor DksA